MEHVLHGPFQSGHLRFIQEFGKVGRHALGKGDIHRLETQPGCGTWLTTTGRSVESSMMGSRVMADAKESACHIEYYPAVMGWKLIRSQRDEGIGSHGDGGRGFSR